MTAAGRVPLVCVALLTIATASAASEPRLIAAVKSRDTSSVRALLKQHAPVNERHPDGTTALHWAAARNDIAAAALLISAGAQTNVADDDGVTPLWLAAVNGSAPMVRALLKAGANPNAVLQTGETVLMMAARTGNVDAVAALLDRGANVHATEPARGQTALMWGAAEGHAPVVHLLIQRGSRVDARSTTGFTPLLFAARSGNLETLRILLAAGASVNESSTDGTTPLMVATMRGYVELAQFLLEQKADPNAGPGFAPLHWVLVANYFIEWGTELQRDPAYVPDDDSEWSVFHAMPQRVRLALANALLAHGADPNARSKWSPRYEGTGPRVKDDLVDATPFLMVAKLGDAEMMRFLVAHGADPDVKTAEGTTALMLATGVNQGPVFGVTPVLESSALEAVKYAVELGQDVNAVNAVGDTPLIGATYRGRQGAVQIVRFLTDHGAQVNVTNKRGWTPLAIAEGLYFGGSDTKALDTAELLRTLGATPTAADFDRDGATAMRRIP